ncbi:MAG: cysteine peptidase family C39 domain-containing protein [Planctomycetota bacterium]|jgi:hypothetical protein
MRRFLERQGIWVYDKRRVFALLLAAAVFTIMLGGTVKACEVIWAILCVGETEDEATEDCYAELTLCDEPEEYWFRVRWKARESCCDPEGDNDFHVEVHDMTEDISVWEDEHIEDQDPGDIQQEVHEVDSPAQALQEGVHTLRAYAKRRDVGEWVQSTDATVDVRDDDLGCTPQEMHKDTSLVCVKELSGPGCPQTGTHCWDADHGSNGCNHEGWYCNAASIAVVTDYFGGNLSQDRITYKVFAWGNPVINLAHSLPWLGGHIKPTFSWALNDATIAEDGTPTFGEIKSYICDRRPMLASHHVGGNIYHTVVIDGCHTADGNDYIHVLDPDSGTENNEVWGVYNISDISVPPAGATGRSDESSVSTDTDSDGLMDFDEINRFNDSPYNFSDTNDDSDNDGKNDKEELADMVFGP